MKIDYFLRILKKLSQDESNRDLEYAINSWLKEIPDKQTLSKSSPYIEDIKTLLNESETRQLIERSASADLPSILRSKFGCIASNGFSSTTESRKKMKQILLISFMVIGAGFLLYYLSLKSKKSKADSSNPKAIATKSKTFLVLMIDSEQENLVISLKEEGYLAEDKADDLCYASRFLWKGTDLTRINNLFYSRNRSQHHEESEFDIYFVKIEIPEYIEGFDPDKALPERLDAFRKLARRCPPVECSPRLSSDECSAEGFYHR